MNRMLAANLKQARRNVHRERQIDGIADARKMRRAMRTMQRDPSNAPHFPDEKPGKWISERFRSSGAFAGEYARVRYEEELYEISFSANY